MNKLLFLLMYAYQRSAFVKGPIQQSVSIVSIQFSTNILSILILLYSTAVSTGLVDNPREFPNIMIPGVVGYFVIYLWMTRICNANLDVADQLKFSTQQCRTISFAHLIITIILFSASMYLFSAVRGGGI